MHFVSPREQDNRACLGLKNSGRSNSGCPYYAERESAKVLEIVRREAIGAGGSSIKFILVLWYSCGNTIVPVKIPLCAHLCVYRGTHQSAIECGACHFIRNCVLSARECVRVIRAQDEPASVIISD
jgi:hypothetical protein